MNSPEAAVRAYFKALNAADLDGIVAVFAVDGSIMADEFPSATGREQLRGLFAGIFKARSFGRELHIDRIIDGGDLAAWQTHTTGTMTILETNTMIQGCKWRAVGPPEGRFRVAHRGLHVQPIRACGVIAAQHPVCPRRNPDDRFGPPRVPQAAMFAAGGTSELPPSPHRLPRRRSRR